MRRTLVTNIKITVGISNGRNWTQGICTDKWEHDQRGCISRAINGRKLSTSPLWWKRWTKKVLYRVLFSLLWQNVWRERTQRKVYADLCFKGTYHGGEGMLGGAGVHHLQPESSEKCSCSATFLRFVSSRTPSHGMVPPTFRVSLPTPINIIYIILCRHLQRLVSMVILDPVMLTMINCYNVIGAQKTKLWGPGLSSIKGVTVTVRAIPWKRVERNGGDKRERTFLFPNSIHHVDQINLENGR